MSNLILMSRLYDFVLAGVRRAKSGLFADEVRYRRIWFGLCRGCYLPLNMRHSAIIVLGLYETEIASYFKSFSSAGGCLYDVGANHGYYTLAYSRFAGAARVYAFEPDQQESARCREAITRNRPDSKIEVFDLFIGRTVNERERQETLDDLVFVKGFDAPTLIKMDVEGAEYEILCGAVKVLAECKPKLIVEVHSPRLETDCKVLLERSGYAVRVVKNNPLLRGYRQIELNRWLAATPR
jgi:hypothetical protein